MVSCLYVQVMDKDLNFPRKVTSLIQYCSKKVVRHAQLIAAIDCASKMMMNCAVMDE